MPTPYVPTPPDAGEPPLPVWMEQVADRLAERVHDEWARGRVAEGWTFGARRDEIARTHPSLVPYASLSTAEQEYDRRTVRATIRGLLALGYQIVPPNENAALGDRAGEGLR